MSSYDQNRLYRVLAPLPICAALVLALSAGADGGDASGGDETVVARPEPAQTLDLSLPEDDREETALAEIELQPESSPLLDFVDECIELDAVPLVELSDSEEQRVFFGVDFDGTLGIHVRQ